MKSRTRRFDRRAAARWIVCAGVVACAAAVEAAQTVPAYRGAGGRAPSRSTARHGVVDATPNRFQRERLESLARGHAAIGDDTLRVVAFQVQFTDTLMGGVRDTEWFTNELLHAEQYFRGASRGRLTVSWTLVDSLYSLPHNMNYYGADSREETRVVELAQALIEQADDDVDFALYDHVFIIHAGAGQETDVNADSPNQLWSSFYDRGDIREAQDDDQSNGIPTDDVKSGDPFSVDNFSIVPGNASQDFVTIGTLGIWVFELGSRVGLVPLFDSTPQGAPDSQGVGNFCLMAYGIFNVNGFVPAFPCAFNRTLAGWLDPVVIDAGDAATAVRLTDVNTGLDADTLCVKIPITDSEYYLVTNRVHDANFDSLFTFGDADSNLIPANTESLEDAEFDFFLTDFTNPAVRRYDSRYGFDVLFRHTGSGVYIWHVDERVVTDATQHGYLADDYPARKGVDLEEADGVQDLDRVGPAAFALGSYFDSYRTGEDNNTVLGPDSKPASRSNAGATTGIVIETLSVPGLRMRVSIRRQTSYDETRARWSAAANNQPATVVNWDDAGAPEIIVLGDDAGVFVFDETGREKVDPDANPNTIAPFISIPGVKWSGPPAFANLDGTSDIELVASTVGGTVYAWKANGTIGLVFVGQPAAAPPLLIDIGDGGTPEIAIAEHDAGNIRIRFVSATGTAVTPPAAPTLWPATVPAQFLAPLAVANISGPTSTSGIVACGVDSTESRVVVQWTPFNSSVSDWSQAIGIPPGWKPESFLPSAPAVGDLDHDGDDEIVIATPDGVVHVFDFSSGDVTHETGTLAARYPSAPALGDVDNDGTLEIAIWDAENMYLLKSNARPMLEWPRAIRPESAGDAPAVTPHREMESPVIADFDGDNRAEVVFPLDDGTLAAFDADASSPSSFPRAGPAEAGSAPTLAELSPGASSLVILGAYAGLEGVDTVVDTLASTSSSSLALQSLGSAGVGAPYWPMARVDLARTGRVSQSSALATSARTFDEESFIIYPNPVKESMVHARVTTNTQAHVRVSIYTLEGVAAASHEFDVNPSGVIDTPFDEAIDVSRLKSGVYFMRLEIDGPGGSGAVYKPFAIRR